MRLSLFSAVAAAALVGLTASPVHADPNYDVSVSGGKVTVTAHAGWHINLEFPWKLTVGDTKLDKSRFTLDKAKASVEGAPKGTGQLRGAICSENTCMPFKADVTIK